VNRRHAQLHGGCRRPEAEVFIFDEHDQLEPTACGQLGVRVLHPDLLGAVSFSTHSLSGGPDYISAVRNVCRHVT
jgi:hypothetical protein